MLVEHAGSNQQVIPQALIYSTMVWVMMAQDIRIRINDPDYVTYEMIGLSNSTSISASLVDDMNEEISSCSTRELIENDGNINFFL